MVHGFTWDVLVLRGAPLPSDQPRRIPHRGGPRRHVDEHQRARPDLSPCADPHHAVADLGMPVADSLSRPAERDVMENGHVVADDGGLADDDPGGVVEEDPLADPRRRVDVDGEHVGYARLEGQGERAAGLGPEDVGNPVGLHCEEALEDSLLARWKERSGEGRVGQHGGVEVARQRRLGLGIAAGFGLDLVPHPQLVLLRLRRGDCRHGIGDSWFPAGGDGGATPADS
ncbi:unnamed protein product [Spirodela intermedia]|uniref:Uncharacterized protein n=1 Tax=Spirodela intermedia TaxID=51605 RepID=A0A7I8J7P9_SPIIN|nr:unnamed protein product [Spirodela intermedia]CAA6666091.1 unnamed protein product [Spirodela intermedia]